jgi:hypothetical protein
MRGVERDAATAERFPGPSLVQDGEILARGVPIGELISGLSFVEMVFFQLQARRPTPVEARMMDAYLVSLCEHGVTSPSTHGSRVAASVRAPFAAAAIGFISTAMGDYHFGALQLAMEELLELERTGESPEAFVARRAAARRRVWGYGHRFHKSTGDPEPERSLEHDREPLLRVVHTAVPRRALRADRPLRHHAHGDGFPIGMCCTGRCDGHRDAPSRHHTSSVRPPVRLRSPARTDAGRQSSRPAIDRAIPNTPSSSRSAAAASGTVARTNQVWSAASSYTPAASITPVADSIRA